MTWDGILNLYLDITKAGTRGCLLVEKTATALASADFIAGDKPISVALWFRTPVSAAFGAASTSAAVELADNSVIVMAGKLSSALSATTLLFSATPFAKSGSGDNVCYEGALDLNTVEIIAAWAAAGEADSLSLYVDIEVENADNSKRSTFQFAATLYRQVYAGEADPTTATPFALNTPAGNLQRCQAGVWQIKDVDTGLWHGYWLESGILKLGPGEE